MVFYECDVCMFATIRKNQYERHLKTNKHIRKTTKCATQKKKSENEENPALYSSQEITIAHNIFTEKKGPENQLSIAHKSLNLPIKNDISEMKQNLQFKNSS